MNKKSLLVVSTIIVMLVAQLSVDARLGGGGDRSGGGRATGRTAGRRAQRADKKRAGAQRQNRARGQRPKKRSENHPGKKKPGKANKQRHEGQRPSDDAAIRRGPIARPAVAAAMVVGGTAAASNNNGVDDLNDNWASYEEYEGQYDGDFIEEQVGKNRPQ